MLFRPIILFNIIVLTGHQNILIVNYIKTITYRVFGFNYEEKALHG